MIGSGLVLLFVLAIFVLACALAFAPNSLGISLADATGRDLLSLEITNVSAPPARALSVAWGGQAAPEMAAYADDEAAPPAFLRRGIRPPDSLFGPLAEGLRRAWRWSLLGAVIGFLLGLAVAILRLAA